MSAHDTRGKPPATVSLAPDGAILIRIEQAPPAAATADDLMAFPFGLEREAARDLIRRNVLKTAKIGRKRYARRSDVLGLVERLADESAPLRHKAKRGDAKDDAKAAYLRLVGARK